MGTISPPAYVGEIDLFHNSKVEDVLVLEASGSPTALTLIQWDTIATPDQLMLINLYSKYGFPTSPAPGRHIVKIDSTLFTGSPHLTGLKGSDRYTVKVRTTGPGSPNTLNDITVTIKGSNAQTFPQLAATLSAAFADVSVSVKANNDLLFTTTAVGAGAFVEVQRLGTLFNPASPLLGFNGFTKPLVGVDTTRDVLELNRNDSNVLFSDRYNYIVRKRRPYINQPQIIPLRGFRTEYFDSGSNSLGSPRQGVWRLLGTNALSGSPATAPSWLP